MNPTVETSGASDIWRKIPPEEKLALIAKAQARGVSAGLSLLALCASVSVGFKTPWLFWCAFLGVPFTFQFATAKAWRHLKPVVILEYLAARSAARRYAFSAHGKNLTVKLMFKGTLEPEFDKDEVQEELEARIEGRTRKRVWIALFPDTVIMISEREGGAKLEFAHSLDENLDVTGYGFDDDNPGERYVSLVLHGKNNKLFRYRLTSDYQAALYVFERQVKTFKAEVAAQKEREKVGFADMISSISEEIEI